MISADDIARAWRAALELWDAEVTLSPPEAYGGGGGAWSQDEPLAYIDMKLRQVVVNYPLLEGIGAAASLPAVYAHELGHHLRFPHTLGLSASLELLQRRLIPSWPHSLTNLFFDLQVNEAVGRTRAEELCAVYRGFNAHAKQSLVPYFAFYLAVYEELWARPRGELVDADSDAAVEGGFPGWRSDARMFAQTFYALTDTYAQFVYFCSRIARYLPEGAPAPKGLPLGSDVATPGVDDYVGALDGNSAIDRALEEAAEKGWLDEAAAAQARSSDPLDALSRITGLPGTDVRAFKAVATERIYRRLVERHLIKLPASEAQAPDPFLPTTTVAWEPGDALRSIDWTQSVLTMGALAALSPLRRELESEPPPEPGLEGVGIEIYLDTSGSMPDPSQRVNAMTLAALVLATAAIRAGGKVRAIVYSSDADESPWMRSEELARRFLLRYSGGGTDYPWAALARLADAEGEVLRVVISDSDFLYNVANGSWDPRSTFHGPAMGTLLEGVRASRVFVALLAADRSQAEEPLAAALREPKFRLALVDDVGKLPEMAARLARAFWGK